MGSLKQEIQREENKIKIEHLESSNKNTMEDAKRSRRSTKECILARAR